jgi:acetyltransferase-like isoleucine patch superfamily enzyme|mmetsp:Transcript_16090/g.19096  ORF Transcript_16090/g.19096 Transcript_16090/m.19096 type:complete len:165 (-) Transcript_16090:434-928(-)
MQRQLHVLKKIGGFAMNDDTLEALHNNNVKTNVFDREFEELILKQKEKSPKAEILGELAQVSHDFKKKYNTLVDTNVRIIEGKDGEEKAAIAIEQGAMPSVELYTTAHLASAHQIHNFIVEYLNRKKTKGSDNNQDAANVNNGSIRSERLNQIAEVSSHQENTN